MYKNVAKLILYSNLGKDSILTALCDIFRDWEQKKTAPEDLVQRIYIQIKRLLDVSTDYGFDRNLWQDYLTFVMITNENSFSVTCEGVGPTEGGSVNEIAKNDFRIFHDLFHFDFGPIEQDLKIDCFSRITNYKAISKREKTYNKDVSDIVQKLSVKLDAAVDENEFFDLITEHYKTHGVGMFGFNKAFRIAGTGDAMEFCPINNADEIRLSDLIGYEIQKKELVRNTLAFCEGRKANDVLLYGDSGTGKSSSVKAVLNEYCDRGLRMIEIYKYQFRDLSNVIARIKKRNYKFIIFIDDLSFEEDEVEYKFLKAVIEGGVESRPENVLIYATSNRRHLIKEMWSDRDDMEYSGEIHRSDTMEEKLSLSSRFGITINYSVPSYQEYLDMVKTLAEWEGLLDVTDEKAVQELLAEARKWEIRHGGVSGRTAKQFIHYIAGR
ncbi:MAG: ATP-binding protein [Lachnospiraceae bacterium]|nr:ATP-binding protein [Lachnospiraceae bacterium]